MRTPEKIADGLERLVAPNPSAMTFEGTNTYILGDGAVAVIDPGPDMPEHLAAIRAALRGRVVSHILVTHAHSDHSALAPGLSRLTGAPVLAFGDVAAGRDSVMDALVDLGPLGGGEGCDDGFVPDLTLDDGAEVRGPDWQIDAIWTPGHMGNHMSFRWGDHLFSGDTVMGWSTSLISPPDGSVAQFLRSCRVLAATGAATFWPGHGPAVADPADRIAWLVAHRRSREDQILQALSGAPGDAANLAARIYDDLPAALCAAASRNVLAHLIDLSARGLVTCDGPMGEDTIFTI